MAKVVFAGVDTAPAEVRSMGDALTRAKEVGCLAFAVTYVRFGKEKTARYSVRGGQWGTYSGLNPDKWIPVDDAGVMIHG